MMKLAQKTKIASFSTKVANAIEEEIEEVLLHAEEVVKKYVPANKVKSSLKKIESSLEEEGIEVEFDKTVSREALRKSAKDETPVEEIEELVEEIVKAVVDELEEVLADADEVCNEEVEAFDSEDAFEVESRLKHGLEKIMANKGVNFKLERKVAKASTKKVAKKAPKKMTLLEKVRSAK